MPGLHPEAVDPALAIAQVDIPEALPIGVANEAGMQPNTILVARAISARFPQIGTIDGVRPDSKPWHPNGLAIDIMIPNPSSPEGIALGDEILAFVTSNAGRFGMQDVIWRGTYYTPGVRQDRNTATTTTCTSPRHHVAELRIDPMQRQTSGIGNQLRAAPAPRV